MLILSRRLNETLVIGDNVFLSVLGIKGNQVRIGINAPKDISVHREEIFVKVKAQQEVLNAEASELDVSLMDAFRSHQKSTTTESQMTH